MSGLFAVPVRIFCDTDVTNSGSGFGLPKQPGDRNVNLCLRETQCWLAESPGKGDRILAVKFAIEFKMKYMYLENCFQAAV